MVRQEQPSYLPVFVGMCIAFLIGIRFGSEYQVVSLSPIDTLLQTFNPDPASLNFEINTFTLTCGLYFSLIVPVFHYIIKDKHAKMRRGTEHGSSRWNDPSYFNDTKDMEIIQNNHILTATEQFREKDPEGLPRNKKRNHNILLIGGAGTGKSFNYVLPNGENSVLLPSVNKKTIHKRSKFTPETSNQNNSPYIAKTLVFGDPKGELCEELGTLLKMGGYDIRVFNLYNTECSNKFNPIEAIRYEITDEIVDLFMDTAEGRMAKSSDPFWEKAEKLFLSALFEYTLQEEKIKNVQTVLKLVQLYTIPHIDEETNEETEFTELDFLMEKLKKKDPSHLAVNKWHLFKVAAHDVRLSATIATTAIATLNLFNNPEILKISSEDNIELDRIGNPMGTLDEYGNRKDGKIAYFIQTNPASTTFNFYSKIFYSALQKIITSKDKERKMRFPVHMYLDEFAQLGKIPNFERFISYARAMGVGITVIVQSLSQIYDVYGPKTAETIQANCDYTLYMGTNDFGTQKLISDRLGSETLFEENDGNSYGRDKSSSLGYRSYGRPLMYPDEVARIPRGYGILLVGGTYPFYSKLYDPTTHPNYKYVFNRNIERKAPHFTKQWQDNHKLLYDHMKEMINTEASSIAKRKRHEKENDLKDFLTSYHRSHSILDNNTQMDHPENQYPNYSPSLF